MVSAPSLMGYVNQQTTIPLFFKQYELSLEHSLEKEIEAAYDTICTAPVLKTPSPMERQAANIYTREVFAKFQEELVEAFVYTANKIERDGVATKYRVARYEHNDRAYIVTLRTSEMQAKEQSADSQGLDTLTSRFNNLCLEAIKYVEEGAIAIETCNAATSNLKEGGKKIASVKKSFAKVTPPSSHGSGNSQEENNKKTPTTPREMIPSLWPWQNAMPPRFNPNYGSMTLTPAGEVAAFNLKVYSSSLLLSS
uniref:Protein FAR1-RELATED SEQUENCE n=1 Tax=Populus alba TaxID=43335 RepID=A0A4U5R2M5_POPAL|nr:hypothetical protein D5086_0000019900 [Populus alba]